MNKRGPKFNLARQVAIDQGQRIYLGGKICKQHGQTERYVSDGCCVLCKATRLKDQRQNLSEKQRARRRELERLRYQKGCSIEKWLKRSLYSAKLRAQEKELPFNLDHKDLMELWTGVCPVFNIELKWNTERTNPDDQATLDRIIPEKGYVTGNVVFLSNLANRIKTNANAAQIRSVSDWLETQELRLLS